MSLISYNEDFTDRFVGPIGIAGFFKRFMPDAPTPCPVADFSEVAKHVNSSKSAMYEPFVRRLRLCVGCCNADWNLCTSDQCL